MLSILLPQDVQLQICTFSNSSAKNEKVHRFIQIEGPKGSFIKKRGDFNLSQLSTAEGSRIFVSGVSQEQESQILGQLWKQSRGLSLGYRKRLRLVGIGFRAVKQQRKTDFIVNESASSVTPDKKKDIIKEKALLIPKHILRSVKQQIQSKNRVNASPQNGILLKLGFSHDSGFPLSRSENKNIKIEVSRPDGRTKGTVISLEGGNLSEVSSIASIIQKYRRPDIYKGKGIHTDGRKLNLKKGKRQG